MRVTKTMKRKALQRAGTEFGPDWLKPSSSSLAMLAREQSGETVEDHSIEPWVIIRCVGRMEATAAGWFERNGYECWYPQGRFIKTRPLREIASNMRHKKREEVVEAARAAYPGYLLVRWMFGSFDLNRAFELPGVIGVCCFGEQVATVADFEVELMRLAAARGKYDKFATAAAERAYFYRLSKDDADKRYTGETTTVGRSCESGSLVTFQKTLDRITRVIAAPVTAGGAAS